VPFRVWTSAALNETRGPGDEVADNGVVVQRAWAIEFVRNQLTSFRGLELLRHYCELIGLNRCIRHGLCEHDRGGDFGCVHLMLSVVGARRLKHCAIWRGTSCLLDGTTWPGF
jgi:hypothetical protein